MSENRRRSFVVRLGPRYADIVRDAAGRNACSNSEAVEALIDRAKDAATVFEVDAAYKVALRQEVSDLRAEIERLTEALKAQTAESARDIAALRERPHEAVHKAALAEIERLKSTRAVESSDAIDAVREYAREKAIPENEAADRLIEIGFRRWKAWGKK